MAQLFSKRLLWILGLFPLLSAEFAVATSLMPLSAPEQRLWPQSDSDRMCLPETLQSYLEQGDVEQSVDLLEDCSLENSDGDAVREALHIAIQSNSERQQIAALYGLQTLAGRRTEASSTLVAKWLRESLEDSDDSDGSGDSLGALKAASPTVQAVAASTLSAMAVNVIAWLESVAASTASNAPADPNRHAKFLALLNGQGDAPFNLSALVVALEEQAVSTNPRAAEALRELGYALQAQVDELQVEAFSNPALEAALNLDRPWADQVVIGLVAQLSNDIRAQADSEQADSPHEPLGAERRRLVVAAQVAKVEALAAFMFLSDSAVTLPSEAEIARQQCRLEVKGTATDIGIQFLNCLSALPHWQMPSGERLAIETSVRATAVSEFERLGTLSTFRGPLAVRLRAIATMDGQDIPDASDRYAQNRDATDIELLRISSIEAMGRVQQLPDRPQPRPRRRQEQGIQARTASAIDQSRPYLFPSMSDLTVLGRLANGLGTTAQGDEANELQQRAEIAFRELYGQDFPRLANAASYAIGSGNTELQHNVVKALGGVNYQRLPENFIKAASNGEGTLTQMTQFLGFSLLCSPNAEVRRDAAFALAQIASYHPAQLKAPLASDWGRLFSHNRVDSQQRQNSGLGEPFEDLCQAIVIKDEDDSSSEASWIQSLLKETYRGAKTLTPPKTPLANRQIIPPFSDAPSDSTKIPPTKVMDALVLRLGDREQNTLVAAALALSRYGLALSNDLSAANFTPRDGSAQAQTDTANRENPDQTQTPFYPERTQADLDRLKACMHVLISPTRYSDWPDEVNDDPMYAPLIAATERYSDECQYMTAEVDAEAEPIYQLPGANSNESAIAAAFVLGQIGISDGAPAASEGERDSVSEDERDSVSEDERDSVSEDERDSVAFLLRSLRGRDLLAQRQVGASPPEDNITSVNTLQMAYPNRRDSVREGIVSYVLSQIHPREDALIWQLINAVTFPEIEVPPPKPPEQNPDGPPTQGIEAVTSPSTTEQNPGGTPNQRYVRSLSCDAPTLPEAPPCIDDPMTRAAIIGAIEVIGLEALREIETSDSRHRDQRLYVENYLVHVRRLLTQDISPVVTEAVATTVVERIMTLANPADPISDLLSNRRSDPTESSPSLPLVPPPYTAGSSPSSSFDETPTAQGNQTNPLSIHGNLAATRYTLSLPFTSIYSCAGAAYSLARLGVYDDKTVDQLIDYLLVYPQPLRRLPLKDGSFGFRGNSCMPTNPDFGDVQPSEPLPSVLEQLIIFKTGAIEALGAIEPHSFQDVRVVSRDEERGIKDGKVEEVVTYLVRIANLEVFAPDFPEIPKCLDSSYPDNTNSEESDDCEKTVEIRLDPDSEIVQGFREFSFSDEQIHLAQQLSITPDDIQEGYTQGLVAIEVLQATKWGLTPQEFFILKLKLQESAIAAIGQLALHPNGRKAIKALNPDPAKNSNNHIEALNNSSGLVNSSSLEDLCYVPEPNEQEISEIITGQSSRGIQGLSGEEIKELKIRNLGAILQAFQKSTRNNECIIKYIDNNDDAVVSYLISELDFNRNKYNVRGSIGSYFKETDTDELGKIDNEAIDALADNLSQEVRQLALRYEQEYDQISEDTRQAFPNLSTAELDLKIDRQRDELGRDYTKQLQERAAEILRSEERFQDEALSILVDLETDTIQSLDLETRATLIEKLGVTSNLDIMDPNAPRLITQRCLNDPDVFDRERFCHGLARLVSAALTGKNGGTVSSENVDASINLLRTLAGDPRASDQSDDSQVNDNSRNNNLSRISSAGNNSISANTTPVIQRSVIEYLGSLNSLGLGINSSNQFHSLLLARITANNQPGVIETSVATYLTMPPEVGAAELANTLAPDNAQQAAAVQMVARLGQAVYSDNNVDDDNYAGWRDSLQNERLIAALVNVTHNDELKTDAISAIGHIRTNSEAAITLLRDTLLDREQPLERRIAAAHALGNIISTQGMIIDGLDDDLRRIVIARPESNTNPDPESNANFDPEPNELRVVTAYALSKFDDVDEGINALSQLQRMEIAYSLIHLYEDAQAAPSTGGGLLINPNTQKALILYALSQIEIDSEIASRPELETPMAVRNLIDRVGKVYADALGEDNPIAVRAMAATYAHNIPLWNADLVDALIAAFEDTNLAVRYAAVESVRTRPKDALGNLVYPDRPSPKGRLFEALSTVFWDEREYAFVRLRAGLALDDQQEYRVEGVGDRYPEEPDDPFTGAVSTATPTPENQEFVDMLNALKALDENSIGFRTSSSDAILQALRSAEILGEFDAILTQEILFKVLNTIRDDPDKYPSASPRRGGPPLACLLIGWFCGS